MRCPNPIIYRRRNQMSSPIGSKSNVKIFILYLMDNINYPLSFTELNDVIRQTDYVMYLDFAEALPEMVEYELVSEDRSGEDAMYEITKKGRIVVRELNSDIISSILEKSMTAALRFLDFSKRGIESDFLIEKTPEQDYKVTATIKEKGREIFRTVLHVTSYTEAERMRRNFYERPEVIFKGSIALLEGSVDYLLS